MGQTKMLSRVVFAAVGAFICSVAALGQTPAPAPSPAAPAASQLSPTATINTPGYPTIGPANPQLRVVNLPGGKRVHLLTAPLETNQWGWFDNAQPQPRGPGHDYRANQEIAYGFPGSRATFVDGTHLYRGGATGRCAQGYA